MDKTKIRKKTARPGKRAVPKLPPTPVAPGRKRDPFLFTVVGVGASAGGLQAFKDLLHYLPHNPGLSLVLVQHLEPHHESSLVEILSRETGIPITQIYNGQKCEPGHIYIIPPNAYLALVSNRFRISPRDGKTKNKFLPIDYFLNSLAQARGQKAVAVILSGTGSDGTLGAMAVHAAGGLTLAQDEKTAQYGEMPGSAVAAQCIDLVLPPKEITARLMEFSLDPGHPSSLAISRVLPAADQTLEEIFHLVKKFSGVDFSRYKRATILRRINRRLITHHLHKLKDYLGYLEKQPDEIAVLYQDLLIPVTSFFRDPDYFNFLKRKVFPALIAQRNPLDTFRIWVPGCSTGQEVYSLAICLTEFLTSRNLAFPVQVFGTDVNEAAVTKARQGIYPASVAREVPPATLKRYFLKTEQGFKIDKTIRDLCLFSRHNLISDPPFSNLDLLSLRNLLIYLDASLQKKIFPMLHFSLKPTGYLMLGSAETISAFPALFKILDKRLKIFACKAVSPREHVTFMPEPIPEKKAETRQAKVLSPKPYIPEQEADRILLNRYMPAGVLVNNQLDIIQFRGHTGAFLEPAAGRASLNLLGMVREGLWNDLRDAIEAARRQGTPVRRKSLVRNYAGLQNVILDVTPLLSLTEPGKEPFFLIIFDALFSMQGKNPVAPEPSGDPGVPKSTRRLQQENSELKEYIFSLQSESKHNSVALRSAQEEMQSSNEELQSMNEELETSKEELQSSNEELITTNEELKEKNRDLLQINNDLGNVLGAIDLPLLILDKELKIRKFTPSTKSIFSLISADIGRSVNDIKLKIAIPDLEKTAKLVIKTLQPQTMEIGDLKNGWYTLAVKPYLTAEMSIDGVLLTFVDVTRMKENLIYSENIVATLREPVIVLDTDLKVISANHAFYKTFLVTPTEVENQHLYSLNNHEWDIPQLRELLEKIIPLNPSVVDFVITHTFSGLGEKTMLLNARRINPASGKAVYTLLAIEDITDRYRREKELKEVQDELVQANQRKDEFLSMLAHELRNPLAPIWTSLELMKRDPAPKKEKILERIERIRRQVVYLTRIVDDLMDTSRISRGLISLKKEQVNFAELVTQAVETHQTHIEAKNQVLQVHLPTEPLELFADPVRVVQIISNLLDNASKYTPEKGNIEVRAYWREHEAVVEVLDDGIGLSPEALPKVFNLFYQFEKGLDRMKGGLGIGLTLAKNLAVLHGGMVDVHSPGPGKGSVFTLRLPLPKKTPVTAAPAVLPAAVQAFRRSSKLKILIVEDNLEFADSMSEFLTLLEHKVWQTHNGPDALRQANTVRPDVVLLDISLPGMDGYEIAARLHANRHLSRTILVALTGYNPNPKMITQAGFRKYLTKPVDLGLLEQFLAGLRQPAP